MAIKQIALVGDSLTQGTKDLTSHTAYGGIGTWAEQLAERLANLPGVGPLVSSGLRGAWLGYIGDSDPEWSFVGSWSAVLTSDAFDKAPYGVAKYATSTANTATYTRPSGWRAAVGVAIYWIDKSAGGNWQYRIDGGTWTNMGQTVAQNNALKKFYVATPSSFSTIDFRGYDGTSNVHICPVGVEVFFSDPATASGLIVHNIAASGKKLNDLFSSSAGDRAAFLDSVTLGSGAIANTPNAGVLMLHINDVTLANTTTWNTDLTTLYNRVHTLGPVGFVNPWEMANASFNTTTQASYRAQTKTSAASLGALVFDIYDAWVGNGWTDNAAALAAGLILADKVHQAPAGNVDLTPRLYWFARNNFLTVGATVQPFTHGSSALGGDDMLGGHPGTEASLLTATPTVFSPGVQKRVAANLLTNTPSVFSPGVRQNIAASLLNAAATVFSPAVQERTGAAFLNAAPTVFTPSTRYLVAAPLLASAPTVFAPAPREITAGAFLNAEPTVFAPTITTTRSLTAALLNATPAVFAPSVTTGSVTIVVGMLDASPLVFTPGAGGVPTATITVTYRERASAQYAEHIVTRYLELV